MAKSATIRVTEVTLNSGKQKSIRVNLDGQNVYIPVADDVYAYFEQQFVRQNPSPQQKKKFATLMNVIRAAYLKGVDDAGG